MRGRGAHIRGKALSALSVLLCLALSANAAGLPRIMSLNVCTDQLAMMLAAPGQIVSISNLASDPGLSFMHKEAAAYPKNHGLAEEVFLARPDVVVTGAFTLHNTTDLLKHLGYPVEQFAYSQTLDTIPTEIRRMGRILHREAKADDVATHFETGLSAIGKSFCGPAPTAIAYGQNGITQGAGTLGDSVMKAAGLKNLAAELGIHGMAPFPLELLVKEKPDIVILPERISAAPSLADLVPSNPALRGLKQTRFGKFVPQGAWSCGGPFVLEAVKALARVRREVSPCASSGSADEMNPVRLNLTLLALIVVTFTLSLLIGPAHLGPIASIRALIAGGDEATRIIMREIRLPRALLGLAVGASLGLSGAVLQGFLRNPLAEPGIIGVSAMASLGAVTVFYSGLAGASLLALPAGALVGAFLAVLILLAIAARHGSTLTLILSGVALSSLAAALTSLALNLSPNPFASYEIIFWLLGSLKDRSMVHVAIALPLIVIGCALLATAGRALDAFSLGEETAASLGIDHKRMRLLIVIGVALCVGAGTAVTGAISFVGLVVPHVIRPFTNQMPSRLLLPSAMGGAVLLLAADVVARIAVSGHELNVGVVTALIGAPFFLWLIIRSRKDLF